MNFYFPSTPFLELGVDALLVAQPLPSYCALIQAPQWERAINCWWRLLQLRCRHMKNRDDRFDLVKFLIPSRKSVGARSLIPPPLLLFHVTQSANMGNTRRRHPSLVSCSQSLLAPPVMTLPIPSIHCNQCSLPSFPPCSDGVAVGHFWKVLREGERAGEPVGSVRYGTEPRVLYYGK